MPHMGVEPWLPGVLIVGAIVAALVVVAFAMRSPDAMNSPWVASGVALAVIVLAALLWPFLGILLVVLLPAALVGIVVYLVTRRRPAT